MVVGDTTDTAGAGDLVSVLSALEAHCCSLLTLLATNSFPTLHSTPGWAQYTAVDTAQMIHEEQICEQHYPVSRRGINWHTEQLFIRPNHMFILLIHEFIITADASNEVHSLTGILQEAASVMSG